MRRVLSRVEFRRWMAAFLDSDIPAPPAVADPENPLTGHLIGLCFHRSWTQRGIASCLEKEDPFAASILRAARSYENRGMRFLFRSDYQGTH